MTNLALLYLEGDGVECDPMRAVMWLERAARSGDDKAMYNLALSYQDGEGVRKNRVRAAALFRAAAKAGNVLARRRLRKTQE